MSNKEIKEQKHTNGLEEISKRIFENHKDLREVYITSDGFGFTDKNKAENHAQSLENNEVIKFNK